VQPLQRVDAAASSPVDDEILREVPSSVIVPRIGGPTWAWTPDGTVPTSAAAARAVPKRCMSTLP